MSAATARAARPVIRPVTRPAGRTAARSTAYLRLVVTRRSSAAKAPFVAAVVGILAVGLLGLLALNTVLAQDAFRLHALQLQGKTLAVEEQSLQREVEQAQSPQSLAARASALGMVPGGPPAFLRLADGKVLGAAVPGQARTPVVVAPPAAPGTPAVAAAHPAAAPAAGGWVTVPPPSAPHSSTARGTAPAKPRATTPAKAPAKPAATPGKVHR